MIPKKKICSKCERILDHNNNNFAKKKAICKECYNKIYRDLYKKKKEQKLIIEKEEIKNQISNEYKILEENCKKLELENKHLINKILDLENRQDSSDYYKKYTILSEQCLLMKEQFNILSSTVNNIEKISNTFNN